MDSNFKPGALLISFFFLFVIVLVPGMDGHADMGTWAYWTRENVRFGLGHTYLGPTDYLPLIHYILYPYGLLQGSDEAINQHIGYLKVIPVLFDLLGIWFIYKWLDKKIDFSFLFLICMFNPAFSYNSILWGQVDAIQSALVFGSFYFLFKNRIVPAFVLMTLALSFKLQVIIFLPLFGIILLNQCAAEKKWKSLFAGLMAAFAVALIILLPFIQSEASREGLMNVVTNSVGKYSNVTWFAYNFWCLIIDKPNEVSDEAIWFSGITYKSAGLLLFCILSFFAMLPLFIKTLKTIFGRPVKPISEDQLFISGALIAVLFFYVNTEMHERYSHPAFLFIIAYAFHRNRFVPLMLMSLAYFLNLEVVLRWLKLNNYDTLIFDDAFVGSLYTLLVAYLFYRLFTIKQDEAGPHGSINHEYARNQA